MLSQEVASGFSGRKYLEEGDYSAEDERTIAGWSTLAPPVYDACMHM
jgi:hypothetical protein